MEVDRGEGGKVRPGGFRETKGGNGLGNARFERDIIPERLYGVVIVLDMLGKKEDILNQTK